MGKYGTVNCFKRKVDDRPRFARNTIPTTDRKMLRPHVVHKVAPGKTIPVSIPQDALLMLTDSVE